MLTWLAVGMPIYANCFKCYLKKPHDTQEVVGKHFILCLLGVALTSEQLIHPKGRVRKKETAYKM